MNELQKFNFKGSEIRTLTVDRTPFFVGKDVAEVLGYSNPQKAVRTHVDEEDKGVTEMGTPGGKQDLTIINESGLYSLILSSKLPKAKEFKRWVTSEVLPAIRKTGMYAVDQLLDDPDLAIQAFTALKEERERRRALELANKVQAQQIAELKPKASYYDLILNCKDLVSISEIAKDYGMSARKLNDLLHEKGVQFKQGNKIWLLYQRYADQGYTQTKTHSYAGSDGDPHSKVHTYWTQKGRLFIYDLLKKDGILPMIEQSEDRT